MVIYLILMFFSLYDYTRELDRFFTLYLSMYFLLTLFSKSNFLAFLKKGTLEKIMRPKAMNLDCWLLIRLYGKNDLLIRIKNCIHYVFVNNFFLSTTRIYITSWSTTLQQLPIMINFQTFSRRSSKSRKFVVLCLHKKLNGNFSFVVLEK